MSDWLDDLLAMEIVADPPPGAPTWVHRTSQYARRTIEEILDLIGDVDLKITLCFWLRGDENRLLPMPLRYAAIQPTSPAAILAVLTQTADSADAARLRVLALAATPGPWGEYRTYFRDGSSSLRSLGPISAEWCNDETADLEMPEADLAYLKAVTPDVVLGLITRNRWDSRRIRPDSAAE